MSETRSVPKDYVGEYFSASTTMPTRRRLRCSKGHEWEESLLSPNLANSVTFNYDDTLSPVYCMRCIADLMLKLEVGVVIVKE